MDHDRPATAPPMNRIALAIAAVALAALIMAGWDARGDRMVWAALIGALAGVGLYHASFGFTAAWRRIALERRGAGLRAQMLLIGLTCCVSFPLIAWGDAIGISARGNVLPMGVASAFGAFVFGVGMQLGGGCASGTLFTVGGGSTRMVIVLFFFIAGSVLATYHWDFWSGLPRQGPVSIINRMGGGVALALMLAVLAAIWLWTVWYEKRAHGHLAPLKATESLLRGPWSLALGAVVLAIVGALCFIALGRPWGVTAGFALWGAHAVEALGVDVTQWTYWSGWRKGQIERSIFANPTSVMNFGIVIGAFAAAALAGKFAPSFNLSRRDVWTAVIGGLLMGYGARLAYGCNIGAYLGGLVSGSLHGWWWLIWGFIGSTIGVALRVRVGMDAKPAPPQSTI